MAANVLIEELGPRGKARVRTATTIAMVVLAAIVGLVLWKLWQAGQLEPAKWTELFTWEILKFLGLGLLNSIKAAVAAGLLSIVIGFLLALARISRTPAGRGFTVAYVEFFRALPLLLTIFMAFFGLQALGMNIGVFWSAVVALVLYHASVLSEIYRAGINSLDKGQKEAAQSVGMTYWQAMMLVILPQAVRRMIPAIVAQMATLTKDVSLAFVISYPEFVTRGTRIEGFSDDAGNFQAYVFVAVVYFIVIWALARLVDWLDQRGTTRAADIEDDGDVQAVLDESAAGAF